MTLCGTRNQDKKLRELVTKKAEEFKKQRDLYEEQPDHRQDYDECHLLWWWLDYCLRESMR